MPNYDLYKRMKKSNNIVGVLLCSLLLLGCAQKSEKGAMAEVEMAATDSVYIMSEEIKVDTIENTLSPSQLESFGKRALQKVEDYYNCRQIVSNGSYDSTMRNQAKVMASKLFLNNTNTVSYLDSVLKISATISNVKLVAEPAFVNDSTYSGIVAFEEQGYDMQKSPRQLQFVIRKTTKYFGNDQQYVWETLLTTEQPAVFP